MLSIFDQKYSDDVLEQNPHLYKFSVSGKSFNNPAFLRWVLLGIYQSILVFAFPYFSENHILSGGHVVGLWSQGTSSYTVLILAMNLQLAIISKYWTKANLYATVGCVVFYYFFMCMYCSTSYVTPDAYFIIYQLFMDPTFWFISIAGPLLAVLPDFVYRGAKAV